MIPWFPGFDATTMVVLKMLVWVRLHNLPLHFWLPRALEAMGNALGKFLKINKERVSRGIHTFARICVEIDLSQGLPDSIILIHNNTQWKQLLDYENTTFTCRGCQQIGHLLSNCPQVKKDTRRNKKQSQKPRGWQHTVNLGEAAKDEEATIPPLAHDDGPIEEVAMETTPMTHKAPATKEYVVQDLKDSLLEKIPDITDTSGAKRHHFLDHSDLDKENPHPVEDTSLVLFSSSLTQGEW